MPRHINKKEKREKRRVSFRRKACRFCVDKEIQIDYKLAKLLCQFITETGKIVPRKMTGNCAYHQREIVTSINRARVIAVLPYCLAHSNV